MIKSFSHKGLETFFKTGNRKGIQPHHANKLQLQLAALDSATSALDLNAPSWRLHELKGERKGCWSITVNGNWRLTFRFMGNDAELVDYQDYH